MYLYQNNKACENLLLFIFKDVVEKAHYSSCCFLFVERRKITMQWSHVKTFEFVCYCFEINFDVFTIFSELSGLKGNVLFMKTYIPMKGSILSLTKYAIFM